MRKTDAKHCNIGRLGWNAEPKAVPGLCGSLAPVKSHGGDGGDKQYAEQLRRRVISLPYAQQRNANQVHIIVRFCRSVDTIAPASTNVLGPNRSGSGFGVDVPSSVTLNSDPDA